MIAKRGFSRKKEGSTFGLLFLAGLFIAAAVAIILYPACAFADGHEDTGSLDHKVDVENQSGINLMIATLYNDNRLLFALAVTFTMAIVGIIIGQVTGIILRLVGLK